MFLVEPRQVDGPWWIAPGALGPLPDLDVGDWALRPGESWLLLAPRAALDEMGRKLAEPAIWLGLGERERRLTLFGPRAAPRPGWRERLRGWIGLPPVGAAWFDRWSPSCESETDRAWALSIARSIELNAPVLVLDRIVGQLGEPLRRRLGGDLRRLVDETGLTLLVLEEFEPSGWSVPARRAAARLGRLERRFGPPEATDRQG